MATQVDNAPILDALKKYKGISTDKELGDFLGVSRSVVSNWRSNVCKINATTVMAAMPEVNMNYLLTGEGELLRPGCDPSLTPITIKEEDPALPDDGADVRIAALEKENEMLRQQNATLQKAIDLLSRMS